MNLDALNGRRSVSPASSGRSSPVNRVSRRKLEDGRYKVDKSLRRYAANIERALGSFESTQQEWADYIAFLGRLLKALQLHPPDVPVLPHSAAIASRLAQCLNPALPSGVHQKAVEVYAYIFGLIGQAQLSNHLHEYLPGLSTVLSFASLSVRPVLYSLYEEHIVKLPPVILRPALKSLILGLLPALEDESSEDFDRAFQILDSLRLTFSDELPGLGPNGYFWQCLFLAVITSPSKRQGVLSYLTRRLPSFAESKQKSYDASQTLTSESAGLLTPSAGAAISPEPGLLIRCFAAGLADHQLLVQRGFLDLLVTHLPLSSPVLQARVDESDVNFLVSSAVDVVLRREMSLNRRLWSWFLGPGNNDGDGKGTSNEGQPNSPTETSSPRVTLDPSRQAQYFSKYGERALTRCVLEMINRPASSPSERARPLRICLSLMDRFEIGGALLVNIFLPAMDSVYVYSMTASAEQLRDVLRSAGLFFDGVEATLIWSRMIELLMSGFDRHSQTSSHDVDLFAFILKTFNVRDDEMQRIHIPLAAAYILTQLLDQTSESSQVENRLVLLQIAASLVGLTATRTSTTVSVPNSLPRPLDTQNLLDSFYELGLKGPRARRPAMSSEHAFDLLLDRAIQLAQHALTAPKPDMPIDPPINILLTLLAKSPSSGLLEQSNLFETLQDALHSTSASTITPITFPKIAAVVAVMTSLSALKSQPAYISYEQIVELQPNVTSNLWEYLSPERPKYHVEAIRLLWQLEAICTPSQVLEASLTSLMCPNRGFMRRSCTTAETIRRFAVLWGHSILPRTSSFKAGGRGISRRGSALHGVADIGGEVAYEDVLTKPLFLALESLESEDAEASDVVTSWLQELESLPEVLRILLLRLDSALVRSGNTSAGHRTKNLRRLEVQISQDVLFALRHISKVLRHGSEHIWSTLADIEMQSREEKSQARDGQLFLTDHCMRILGGPNPPCTVELRRLAISVLDQVFANPYASSLKSHEFESDLLERLKSCLETPAACLQDPLLNLILSALRVRLSHAAVREEISHNRKASLSLSRKSVSILSVAPVTPPAQLVPCLCAGFTLPSGRTYLRSWVAFLAEILPSFADAIFANVIPLVECLCSQLDTAFEHLRMISAGPSSQEIVDPEASMLSLFTGLELILAKAHSRLLLDAVPEGGLKSPDQPQGFFGNMVPGVFVAEGPPSRTSRANSRLTVILAFQDAIKICFRVWSWATYSLESGQCDRGSSATHAYNTLKIRNKTRRVLENLIAAEPLECLETLVVLWCRAEQESDAAAVISVLHVLDGTRPKNTTPIIYNALYSRTSPSSLESGRVSSLTSDLTSQDVVAFLISYLRTVDDDAMDEIWADCMTFLRDVLSNPLPQRQVLPALLEVTVLLAEKIDNTNFGEQRKMRKELGDLFLRLLAAIFTTRSLGNLTEYSASASNVATEKPARGSSDRFPDLIQVLMDISTKLQIVLETADRVMNAVNTISNSIIAPMFHAKAFPENVGAATLTLILQMAKQGPAAKSWKRDVADAFNDARLLTSSPEVMETYWFPVLRQWAMSDKERMPELVARITAPSSAGIMFGVGASAARLDADRKTQTYLRKISILLLAGQEDLFTPSLGLIEGKMTELLAASPSSSPSSSTRPELFMLCRAVALSSSAVHLTSLWPIVNTSLQEALMSLLPDHAHGESYGNVALLQACKLLDQLVVLSPDEFQLHEWLYITDTIDAIYRPQDWEPVALSDQVAEQLGSELADGPTTLDSGITITGAPIGRRRPLLHIANVDKEDMKAMAKDDFARAVLRPFLSQLSIHAYDSVYSMEPPSIHLCRKDLLEDLLDQSTIV